METMLEDDKLKAMGKELVKDYAVNDNSPFQTRFPLDGSGKSWPLNAVMNDVPGSIATVTKY